MKLLALALLGGCLAPDPEVGTAAQSIINGIVVDQQHIHDLGLVEIQAPSGGGCSGVLLANDLALTAGHCLLPGSGPLVDVSFEGEVHRSDRVLQFGNAFHYPPGWLYGASLYGLGADLALVHLNTPFTIDGSTTSYARPIDTRAKEDLYGRVVQLFGAGRITVYGGGDPGFYRSGEARVSEASAVDPPYADLIGYEKTETLQALGLGDSGGPTFVDDGEGPLLVGIHMASSVVDDCGPDDPCLSFDTLLAPEVWGLTLSMEHVWNDQSPADVFDVWGAEIRTLRYDDLVEDALPWAQLARISNTVCGNRGFMGGHATGFQLDEKSGMACSGGNGNAIVFAARPENMAPSGEAFYDVDEVEWAQAQRVAMSACRVMDGWPSGYFTGVQDRGSTYELVCLAGGTRNLTATWAELNATGFRVDGVAQTGYAQALRAANQWCLMRGYRTGFLTGKQTRDRYGITCQGV